MPDNQVESQTRPQRELMDATRELCHASLQSMNQLLDLQMRTFTSMASRQANIAGQYWSDTLSDLADPRNFQDPVALMRKQTEILRSCGRRTLDGAIEATHEASVMLERSRQEMDQVSDVAQRLGSKAREAGQETVRDLSRASARSQESGLGSPTGGPRRGQTESAAEDEQGVPARGKSSSR